MMRSEVMLMEKRVCSMLRIYDRRDWYMMKIRVSSVLEPHERQIFGVYVTGKLNAGTPYKDRLFVYMLRVSSVLEPHIKTYNRFVVE